LAAELDRESVEDTARKAQDVGALLKAQYQARHDAIAAALAANAEIDRLETDLFALNDRLQARGENRRRVSPDSLAADIEKATTTPSLRRKRCRYFDYLLVDLDRGNNVRRKRPQRSFVIGTEARKPPPVAYGGGLPASKSRQASSDPLAAYR